MIDINNRRAKEISKALANLEIDKKIQLSVIYNSGVDVASGRWEHDSVTIPFDSKMKEYVRDTLQNELTKENEKIARELRDLAERYANDLVNF